MLETPLGHNQEAIERTFNSLAKRSAFTDIAEQYHLRPIEVLKRKLLATGIFGDLVHAYNDGMGHEYHGVSLIRSYVGFDKSLIRALSMQADVPCFAHKSHKDIYFPGERIINSILEFSNGVQATFHWSWLNYKSPIRSRRSSGFYATKGAAWGPECVVFTDENSEAKQIYFERRTLMVKGMEILTDIVATLDSMPIARWSNPFYQHNLNEDQIVTAFFVENLLKACGDKLAKPLYSPYQAYQDHLIVDAMHKALA